ncbi:UvrABC system protein C [Desulfamplus magnetovallimortis]|uniref:UvrABC system protein C n=1 Tax=Desulfamplus magnetovallimortis TaxID=1246637 RepID=A0A1W1HDF6_9BACT|nr:excinuclease ABC subunit UvrC [Desulfamplus magnetovallimortis]SLM30510.1 UvrABC system protein C [Desulfamplus magnetovallimortis]
MVNLKEDGIPASVMEKYTLSPSEPGVYLMKGSRGRVIYVGKARNLKKRLASYFVREIGHDLKTALLVRNITDFDIIVTATEHEALILEATLIKKHNPKYNIILKDGKNYPCFRIDTSHDYPSLQVVRKIKKDNAVYFGPYSSSYSVKKTVKQVNRIFKLRKCRDSQFKKRSRPCLQYQIKACLAPCCNDVPKETYSKIVSDVILFLKGRTAELINALKKEMMAESEAERFENAAQIRDTVFAIERIMEQQVAVTSDMMDRDVVACKGEQGRAVVTVLFVRSGYVVGTRHSTFDMHWKNTSEIMAAFLKQYYQTSAFIPPQILAAEPFEDREVLEEQLSLEKGKRVHILIPERGDKKRIVEMAIRNAESELSSTLSRENDTTETLEMLKKLLGMEQIPRRIECFDNSNLAGTDPVSSMVVFIDGEPDKSLYRKFIIKDVAEQDDYAYMTEVLTRRFSCKPGKLDESRKKSTAETRSELPDLLVVDGGKGQLSMAVAVLTDLKLMDRIKVVGLAKKNVLNGETHDKIFVPNRSNPLNTSLSLKALYLLQRLRDEAHDFAITFQRKRRSKRMTVSLLDGIPGIGKKRKSMLLKHFKGVSAMKDVSMEEFAKLPGMTQSAAKALYSALKTSKKYS